VRALLLQQATVRSECYRSAAAVAAAGAIAVAVAAAGATTGGMLEHSENRCARVGRFLTLRHSVMCMYDKCKQRAQQSMQSADRSRGGQYYSLDTRKAVRCSNF
jgi:hypothetical protein